jgi:ribosomal protein S12 methylthiotransferase
MLKWIEEAKFERLGIFTYSHEENTHAYSLNDDVPQKEKQRRANAVMKLQQKISAQQNEKMIGKTIKVLFDKKEGNYFIGRTEFDSPDVDNTILVQVTNQNGLAKSRVDINSNDSKIRGLVKDSLFTPGDFADVKIISAKEYDLIGAVVN